MTIVQTSDILSERLGVKIMKKIIVECLVDETRLLEVYKEICDIDNFHDALNAELGVMEENGVYAEHWYVKEED